MHTMERSYPSKEDCAEFPWIDWSEVLQTCDYCNEVSEKLQGAH
jgi:hypothetical protein